MSTERLPRIETVKLPLALFCYLVLMWVPIAISAGLMALWNSLAGGHLDIGRSVVILLVLRQINGWPLTTLFHRSFAHRAFDFHPWLEKPLRIWAWVWLGTGVRAWSILHRWHHAKADTDEDPHSPTKAGGSIWNITRQTLSAYQYCLKHPEEFKRFEYKLPDDGWERFVRSLERRGFWGFVAFRVPLMLALMTPVLTFPGAVLGLPGIMGSIWFSTVIVVNGLSHLMGYRLTTTPGTSTNIFPWDLAAWGETLHHNHHANQGRANFALAWWEIDPAFITLWALSKIGLVRNLKT